MSGTFMMLFERVMHIGVLVDAELNASLSLITIARTYTSGSAGMRTNSSGCSSYSTCADPSCAVLTIIPVHLCVFGRWIDMPTSSCLIHSTVRRHPGAAPSITLRCALSSRDASEKIGPHDRGLVVLLRLGGGSSLVERLEVLLLLLMLLSVLLYTWETNLSKEGDRCDVADGAA